MDSELKQQLYGGEISDFYKRIDAKTIEQENKDIADIYSNICTKKYIVKEAIDLPPPPPAIIQKEQAPITNLDVIAATLIGEAGGEGEKGMHAVMNVIVNRAKGRGDLTRTAVANVLKPKQFSFFNAFNAGKEDMRSIIERSSKHSNWAKAREIALIGLSGKLPDITHGATHYHVSKGSSKVTPSWTSPKLGGKNTEAVITNTIGHHTFLKNIK